MVTRYQDGRVIDDAGILIRNGTIAFVGPLAEADEAAGEPGAVETIDLGGSLCVPALVNAHTHLYSSLARGMAVSGPAPANFVEILEKIWWPLDAALDEETVYVSALLGLMDSARAGVATVIDHHASQSYIAGSLDPIARAAREVGLRVATCFEVSDRAGDEAAAAGIEENLRFARSVRGDASSAGWLAPFMGLHASLTLSDATLDRAVGEARDAGLGCHVHVAEDPADRADAVRRSASNGGPDDALRRLLAKDVLTSKGIAAHCVDVDEGGVGLLAEAGVRVVANVESNMNNAVGRPRLGRFHKAGVPLAVGTDGLGADVLRSAFSACLLERHGEGDPRTGFGEAAALLAGSHELGAATFGLEGAGHLERGAPADIAVLDYDPPTPIEGSNVLGHMFFGALGARVRDLIAGGRWILRDRRFPGIDEASFGARAREAARTLWGRLG